jgi:thioredoxin-related protein
MNHRTKSPLSPLLAAIVIASAFVMAIAAAPRRAATQNHLPAGQSVYFDRARGDQVDWYPWGKEAFRKARERDQPILLAVGATWCTWCKLMERDSYNDAETAGFIASHMDPNRIQVFVSLLEREGFQVRSPPPLPSLKEQSVTIDREKHDHVRYGAV